MKPAARARWKSFGTRMARQEALVGLLCVVPWLLGFLIFTIGPMIVSVYYSMSDWDLVRAPMWVGLANYRRMLYEDWLIGHAVKVTTVFAFTSVPLRLILGLLIAVLLNQTIKLRSFVRTVFYLPSVVSGVAVAMLWIWIFNSDFGLLNAGLRLFGVEGPAWLSDKGWALPALVIMSLWSVGGVMIIFLAGLRSVPLELYDAAQVDGAGSLRRFWHITVPMISPVIFFNLVMGIINALQVFANAFLMTSGGPQYATTFLMLLLYNNAFAYFKMGYASAIAWLIFFYVVALTFFVFRSSTAWVFYTGSREKG